MNACKRTHTLRPRMLGAVALSVSLFAAGGALASELGGGSGLDGGVGVGVGAEVGAGTQVGDSTVGPGAGREGAPGARTLPDGDGLDGDELDGVGEDDDTSERVRTPHDRDGTLNAPADMDREPVTPDPHDEPGTAVPDDSGIRGGATGSGGLNTDGAL